MWNIAVAESSIKAEAYASDDSLLIGNKLWRIWNSFSCFSGKATNVRISLSLCHEDYFNCDDGGCIDLNSKCNSHNDCNDGSDELMCKILELPENYNKQLSPFCFYESRVKVNVTFEIIDILTVDEKVGRIRLKFRLNTAWNDCRLNFLDIWATTALNTLSEEEMAAIWQPIINHTMQILISFITIRSQKYLWFTMTPQHGQKHLQVNSTMHMCTLLHTIVSS
jgi:hypothetical protein